MIYLEQRIDTKTYTELNLQVRHLAYEKKLNEMKRCQEQKFWLAQKV